MHRGTKNRMDTYKAIPPFSRKKEKKNKIAQLKEYWI